MGAVRWTGKGLKLIGQILEAEEVERWLEGKGRELVEEKLKEISVKWLAGRRRAKSKAAAEVRSTVENAETFMASLESSLASLPSAVLNVAGHLQKNGPETLVSSDFSRYLTVCPRGLVREHYIRSVVKELKDSAELSRYEGLPERFLRRVAGESEEAFFRSVAQGSREPLPGNDSLILGVDDDFGWRVEGINGHYYVGKRSMYGTDLREKGQRKELEEELEPELAKMKVKLGKLTKEELEAAVAALPSA